MNKVKYVYGVLLFLFFVSCSNFKIEDTTIEIVDNNRHYYPVLSGQEVEVVYNLKNTGDAPLLITDIITSCGCLLVDKQTTTKIPPGEEGRVSLIFNSSKNIGYVKFWVELYGNFSKVEKEELVFDINVVSDALYTKDYEEVYQAKQGKLDVMINGRANLKQYYLTHTNL